MYHTALGDCQRAGSPVALYEGRRGIVFQADLSEGIPLAMYAADVWYADLPWRAGYQKFAERAGVTPKTSFVNLMKSLGRLIANGGVPAVMVTGRHAVRHLSPAATAPARLNGSAAVACLWGMQAWGESRDAEAILIDLAGRYECVGDFCCGYGRSGLTFSRAGKRYVMSDLSAYCVGEIASQEPNWP